MERCLAAHRRRGQSPTPLPGRDLLPSHARLELATTLGRVLLLLVAMDRFEIAEALRSRKKLTCGAYMSASGEGTIRNMCVRIRSEYGLTMDLNGLKT
jgi:hypothetical protein